MTCLVEWASKKARMVLTFIVLSLLAGGLALCAVAVMPPRCCMEPLLPAVMQHFNAMTIATTHQLGRNGAYGHMVLAW